MAKESWPLDIVKALRTQPEMTIEFQRGATITVVGDNFAAQGYYAGETAMYLRLLHYSHELSYISWTAIKYRP